MSPDAFSFCLSALLTGPKPLSQYESMYPLRRVDLLGAAANFSFTLTIFVVAIGSLSLLRSLGLIDITSVFRAIRANR